MLGFVMQNSGFLCD